MPGLTIHDQKIQAAASLIIDSAETGGVLCLKNGELKKAGIKDKAGLALRSIFQSKDAFHQYIDQRNQTAIRSFIDLCQQKCQLDNRPETNALIASRFQDIRNLTPVLSNHIQRGDLESVLGIVNACFNKTDEVEVLADMQIHDAQMQIYYVESLDVDSKVARINSQENPADIARDRKELESIKQKIELGKKIATENPECLDSPVIQKDLDGFIAHSNQAIAKLDNILDRIGGNEPANPEPEIGSGANTGIESSFEQVGGQNTSAHEDDFEDISPTISHSAIPSVDDLRNEILANRKIQISNDPQSGLPGISLHAYKTQEAASVLQLFSGKTHQEKLQATEFLAKRINPKKFLGKLKNAIDLFKDVIARRNPHWALRRNCVQCSFAVDLFLEQLENPNKKILGIYKADRHQGRIGNRLEHFGVSSVIQGLKDHVAPNTRAIFTVSDHAHNYSHALNVICDAEGSLFVIDGQIGRVYDLGDGTDANPGNPKDIRDFEKASQKSANTNLGVWSRGAAPATWSSTTAAN
jgi:hypothetical protein